jgi:GntR family transcriptional regulator / MocR family aminotransferase
MPEIWSKSPKSSESPENSESLENAHSAESPGDADRAANPREVRLVGLDLHLELSGTRIRLGLETALRGAIRTGRLSPGTRLPSSRMLAADLGLARNTVAEVYSQLVAEGWLTARTGSGTSVAERRAVDPSPGAATRREAVVPRYDLRPGEPDLSAFPRRAWLATARKVLAAAPDHLLGYADPRGLPQLRTVLAATWRGRGASPPSPGTS